MTIIGNLGDIVLDLNEAHFDSCRCNSTMTRSTKKRTFGDSTRPVWRVIKRVLCSAQVLAALVCPISAQDSKVAVDMMGIGSMSCAHWRSTQAHQLEGTAWIYGFWTGLNYVAAASDQAQAKIDMVAIVVEVKKTCAQQMSQTLASAVWTTYLASKK
jgi:redox-regulated HSP33 family molecular chaperone